MSSIARNPVAGRRHDAWRAAAAVAAVAIAIKLAGTFLFFASGEPATADESSFGYESGHIAANLATGHGFSIKFRGSGDVRYEPTAWFSPLYPALLAGLFRVAGVYSPAAADLVLVVNGVCQGLAAGLLYLMGARLLGPATGLLAAALFLANPNGWQFIDWAWVTSLYMLLLALHLYVATAPPGPPVRHGALTGATLGLVLLADGAAITAAPAAWWLFARGYRSAARPLAAAVVATGLVLVPWALRNFLHFGRPNPLRANAGVNLWVGNHPDNRAESFHGLALSPWARGEERRAFARMGEAAYDRWCRERALQRIGAEPTRFFADTAMRASGFWLGEWWAGFRHIRPVYTAGLVAFSLLALAGAVAGRTLPIGPLVSWALFLPLPYYVTVHGHGRYRAPLEPVLSLLAAVALTALARRLRRRSRAEPC